MCCIQSASVGANGELAHHATASAFDGKQDGVRHVFWRHTFVELRAVVGTQFIVGCAVDEGGVDGAWVEGRHSKLVSKFGAKGFRQVLELKKSALTLVLYYLHKFLDFPPMCFDFLAKAHVLDNLPTNFR